MLTIKGAMRLQSISALRISPDILGEKIAANYRLIGTEITSADLLHMAVQEPEQFANMEYHGMLAVENHIHADNRIKLELVNQLVNRLLLCFTPEFTYQDEVFVASVLQKMGIVDVNEFVQQVHQHMNRNVLLNELINHYFSYGSDITGMVETYRDRYRTMHRTELQDFYDKENQFALYLHNSIFDRLMTAECNNIIYSHYCQNDRGMTSVQGIREAVWIEQADAIQLSQLREILFHQINPADWQSDMHYEMKAFSQSEMTEIKVVQCIAAAVLENIVQKIHRGRLQYRDRDRAEWKDYTRIFCQSAEEVFERFWYFHSEKIVDVRQRQIYAQCMTELIQDEWMLVQLLEEKKDFPDSTADIVLAIWENQTIQKQLTGKMRLEERLEGRVHGRDVDLEDEREYREMLRAFREIDQRFRQEKFVQRIWPGQDVWGRQDILQGRAGQQSGTEQDNQGSQQVQEELGVLQEQREKLARERSWQQEVSEQVKETQEQGEELAWDISQLQEVSERVKETQEQEEELAWDISQLQEVNERVKETQEQRKELAWDISQLQEVSVSGRLRMPQDQDQNILQKQEMQENWDISDLEKTQGQQNSFEMVHRQILQDEGYTTYNYMDEFLSQYGEFVSDQKVPFAENAQLLEQINQHNLYMKQLLDSEEAFALGKEQSVSKRVVVDQAKARQSALRAMENPQEVLREIYENASAIERETSWEIERILRITDEKTRRFYRRLLGYDKAPEIVVQNNDRNDDTSVRNDMGGQERYLSGESQNVPYYTDHSKQDAHNHDSSIIKNAIADHIGDKMDVVQNNVVKTVVGEVDRIESNVVKYSSDESGRNENSAIKYRSNESKGNESDVTKYSDDQYSYISSNTVKYDESNQIEISVTKNGDDGADHIRSNVVKYGGAEPDRNERDVIEYSGDELDHIDSSVAKYNSDAATFVDALDALNERARQGHAYNEDNDIEIVHALDALNERARQEHAHSRDNNAKTKTAVDAVLERIAQRADRIYREQIDFVMLDPTEDREHIEFMKNQKYMEKYIEKNEFMKNQENIESEQYTEIAASVESPEFCKIDFVHQPKQQSLDASELHENGLSEVIQSRMQADIQTKLRSELEKIRQEQIRQEQVTQQLMKDIKRKLASESKEQLTRMLNRNLKTQVHEISDIVYHELERRLKNEQRRRGY